MPKETLQFEHSPALILICLLFSAAVAYLLYNKSDPWSNQLRMALLAGRFLLLFLITVLLVGPILKQVQNTYEKPTVVIGLDNSISVQLASDSSVLSSIVNDISELENSLNDNGYQIDKRTLGYDQFSTDKIEFTGRITDINSFLTKVEIDYEGRNLASVVLLSDGIYNQGISPTYKPRTYPIYTVGIGDTIPKRDIYINGLKHNRISYQGNKFPLEVEIGSQGYSNTEVKVSVIHAGSTIANLNVNLNQAGQITTVMFHIEAIIQGLQRYSVVVSSPLNESNVKNNRTDAYIDIVEGKERILFAATSPHPDISAIKSAIEKNANYEVVTFVPGIHDDPTGKFDLVIYHQFPDNKSVLNSWFDKFTKENTPYWIIMGQNARTDMLNNLVLFANIRTLGGEGDLITAVYNTAFTKFDFSDEVKTMLSDAPPLRVPFVRVTTNAQPMLYQKLGSVQTKNPLLLVSDADNNKGALMLGDGLWKWKLYEYAKTEDNKGFNELVLKLVQYLSTRQDKRKFKLLPVKKEINSSESLVLETEVYNHLYENVYGQNISIELTDENDDKRSYSFVNSESNSRYRISGLDKGVYKFTGSTTIDSKLETYNGEFIVKDVDTESLNLTANFELLSTISEQSGGQFYTIESLNELASSLANTDISSIIHSDEAFIPMINLMWVLILLLVLASAEWFTRKYNGQY